MHGNPTLATTTLCPVCAAPHPDDAPMCDRCGLVFASAPMLVAPATSHVLRPGDLLDQGRYQLERLLAQGGMGMLYLARDHRAFGRQVVVKLLSPMFDPAQTGAMMLRLETEARRLAMLRHPAVPQLLSFGVSNGCPFLVMEYIPGYDLLHGLTHVDDTSGLVVVGKPYAHDDVVQWGVTLCDALIYFSAQQPPVVHGDIKPANLMLDTARQTLTLVDFGAVVVPGDADGSYGTPGYAAPEQYRGQAEPSSDVYGLAATLYHLASDDDPTQHPLHFPMVDALGALGEVLRPALLHNVEQRPTAATLRTQLVALANSTLPPLLITPDGTGLRDEAELTMWCVQHWNAAIDWLNGTLPPQIERWHGKGTALAVKEATNYVDSHRALDAALRHIDPHGYGSATAQLTLDTRWIRAGIIDSTGSQQWSLQVVNTGHCYVRVVPRLPNWLRATPAVLSLAPNTRTTLTLHTHVLPPRRRLHAELSLTDGTRSLATSQFSATAPWSYVIVEHVRYLVGPVLIMLALFMSIALIWWGFVAGG